MATGSFIGVTPGAGAKLSTGPTYTDGGNVVQDEKVILGEQYYPSYTTGWNVNVSTATTGSHLIEIMAGASLKVRIRKIVIRQAVLATTAAQASFAIMRLSSAGTGGPSQSPQQLDPADGPSGAIVMTLPTAVGTEGAVVYSCSPVLIQTVGASTVWDGNLAVIDFDHGHSKALVIPAGSANGICIKNNVGIAGASVAFDIWFDEEAF